MPVSAVGRPFGKSHCKAVILMSERNQADWLSECLKAMRKPEVWASAGSSVPNVPVVVAFALARLSNGIHWVVLASPVYWVV